MPTQIFVRNPDGSLAHAATPGSLANEAYHDGPTKEQTNEELQHLGEPPVSRLRETVQALRQAVQQDVVAKVLARAARRRELLRWLFGVEFLVDLLVIAVCHAFGSKGAEHARHPAVAVDGAMIPPPAIDVQQFACLLPSLWWTHCVAYYALGLLAICGARAHLYRWVAVTALLSMIWQLFMAFTIQPSAVPVGSLDAIVSPVAIFAHLPLRLLVGVQSRLLQIELRYLVNLPLGSLPV